MINPYFANYEASEEDQNLTDELIIEAIQCKGVNVKYLQRTHNDFDFLFGEDPTSSFNSSTEIEMYCSTVNGFGGDGELMSKFGLEINDTATFVLNKTRFKEEFPDMVRPKEGDLIFMPYTNAILEIKYVNFESPFFQLGKQFCYELKVETFNFSQEEFNTSDTVIDDLVNSIMVRNPETEVEKFGDNDALEDRVAPSMVWDPKDPFKGL